MSELMVQLEAENERLRTRALDAEADNARLRGALQEWQEAKRAFEPPMLPRFERFPPEVWERLAHAEQVLLALRVNE
jgi:hypothetical protein